MKIVYSDHGLYLELRSDKYDRSKKVSGGVVADYDDKGKILGLEILAVKDIIPSFSPSKTKINLNFPRPAVS